jgi:hypothetical protein
MSLDLGRMNIVLVCILLKDQIAQLLGPSFGVSYCYVFSEVFFLLLTTFLTRLHMIHGQMFTLQMGMADMHEIQILKFG